MEGLNLYAYIFLIIIALLYSAIKKTKKNAAAENKKAVQPQNVPHQNEYEQVEMSEWEKWFEQSDENKEIIKEQKTEPILNSESSIHNSYVPISQNNNLRTVKPQKTNQSPPKQKTKINLNSREDARRAILYSEIIKRKY